jgi:hypothetical protein
MHTGDEELDDLGDRVENAFYFGTKPVPFAEIFYGGSDDRLLNTRGFPLGIAQFAGNLPAFAKIARTAASRLQSAGSASSLRPADASLVRWCVSTYALLTQQAGQSAEETLETRSHPYGSNEDWRGQLILPGAISLKVEWDPQCR